MRILWLTFFLLASEAGIAPYMAPDASFDAERGLLMESLETPEGETVEYERPVVMLPPTMSVGELHTSQRRFVLRVDGAKRDVGSHYFEAELLGTEALEGFGECLRIRRRTVRMDFAGQHRGYEVVEWYARGKGAVKAEGERFWLDADGNKARTEPIHR